jgi:hypothetical protein
MEGEEGTVTGAVGSDLTTNKFYLAPNGVTVLCPDAKVGDRGMVGGYVYIKSDRKALELYGSTGELQSAMGVRYCTTGMTNMFGLFEVRVPPSRVLLLL